MNALILCKTLAAYNDKHNAQTYIERTSIGEYAWRDTNGVLLRHGTVAYLTNVIRVVA
jgi:hypothetical protein